MLDLDHGFFQPLWIRIGVVAVCFGWAGFEFVTGVVLGRDPREDWRRRGPAVLPVRPSREREDQK